MVDSRTPPRISGTPSRTLHDAWSGRRRRSPADGRVGLFSTRAVALLAAAVLLLMAAGAVTGFLMRSGYHNVSRTELARAGNVPVPGAHGATPIATTDAHLMGLVKLDGRAAPGITLTDQHGQTVSLSALDQSHAVVVGFMDDKCIDICPIVAQELADAYHDLGPHAGGVDFLFVNVNAAHRGAATLRSFLAEQGHGVGSVPSFYYVTGSRAALQQVWSAYGIKVLVNPQTATVVHSDALYFVAPGGAERFEATPFANMRSNGTGWLPSATIAQWGRGIAQYAEAATR